MGYFATYTNMFKALGKYTKYLMATRTRNGTPLQRPLFLHFEEDPEAWKVEYQYLYGEDLLVAPVLQSDRQKWDVYLPPADWVSIYDSTHRYRYKSAKRGSWVTVEAPLGRPPVFYRSGTEWVDVFKEVGRIAKDGVPRGATCYGKLTEEQVRNVKDFQIRHRQNANGNTQQNKNTEQLGKTELWDERSVLIEYRI